MLYAGYAIWGGALVVLLTLLFGVWAISRFRRLKDASQVYEIDPEASTAASRDHDMQHRVLMFLMNQKTDAMLASLARSIEQERQKLGKVVRNPSMNEAIDAVQLQAAPAPDHPRVPYEQIIPMAGEGMEISTIARRLELSEAEVSLVMHMNAA